MTGTGIHSYRSGLTGVLLVLLPGLGRPAAAADLSASGLVATTATTNNGLESDLLEQQYNLGLFQSLTPYLSLRLGYQYFDLRNTFADAPTIGRRSRQPLVELLYNRSRLAGRVSFYNLSVDDTIDAEDFDRRSLIASLSWRPVRGPGFNVDFQDERNVADVSAFGRDVDSRRLDLTAFYSRRHWATSYTFETLDIDNPSNAFKTDQKRHEARASAQGALWGGRLSLGMSGRLSLLDRTVAVGDAAEIAEPVPAAAGLFALDATPEIGELAGSPTLVDGDATTPASPLVDVGGASTFRNVGVDLGVTRPVTRLEIAVDVASGPSVAWQVYHSGDNLFWEAVPGSTSSFDAALLRYRIRFPETQDRYFKAVNVSTNPVPTVRVTEVRALLDLGATGTSEASTDSVYRGDVVVGFQPTRRVSGSFGLGASTDETVTAGLVRRDFRETHALARLSFVLAPSLSVDLGYRFSDSENRRDPVLLRTVNQYNVNLGWRPLPTVDAALTFGRRDESEEATLLESQRSVRLGVALQLLEDLRYVADVDVTRLRDPFAGRDRNGWSWTNGLELRPVPGWSLNGSLAFSRYETVAGEALLQRTQYRLWTTWNATSYLGLGGAWWYADEGGRSSLNQSYNLTYTPGDRLTVSATYQGFGENGGYETSTDSLGATYRLFTEVIVFATLSRSKTGDARGVTAEVSNFRAGLQLAF